MNGCRELSYNDEFVVIASDGVFEFLTNQMVGEMVQRHRDDPLKACKALVRLPHIHTHKHTNIHACIHAPAWCQRFTS